MSLVPKCNNLMNRDNQQPSNSPNIDNTNDRSWY